MVHEKPPTPTLLPIEPTLLFFLFEKENHATPSRQLFFSINRKAGSQARLSAPLQIPMRRQSFHVSKSLVWMFPNLQSEMQHVQRGKPQPERDILLESLHIPMLLLLKDNKLHICYQVGVFQES
jgi:hypothetical protein